MTALDRLGLRARLALALVGVAVLAIGLATLLSNRGLGPRVSAAAEGRLARSAEHIAAVAASVYRREGGWTRAATEEVEHLARLDRLRVRLAGPAGGRLGHLHRDLVPRGATARAPVLVGRRRVGEVEVASASGGLLTPEEEALRASLDRLHLVAGAVSAAAALLLAFLIAETLSRPLRRIREAAEQIERGNLDARVRLTGGSELKAVGQALNRLARSLREQEELRKTGVADLAHELRTPVNGLLARIEAAQDGVLGDGPANLEAMHGEALRLTRLLDDLARLAEAERPGLLLERRPVDVAEIARAEAAEFAPRFDAKSVGLETELEPALVDGDPERLRQVAANLLSNALRYTDPGGTARVQVERRDGWAVLEVSDTGMGIPPEDLQRVFTRFWRGERSRSRDTGGAGIGLAIVDRVVRAHDGRVEVESSPGRGSTFRVVLRASRARTGPGDRG